MISPVAWKGLLKDAIIEYEIKTNEKQPITNVSIDSLYSKTIMDNDTQNRTKGRVTGVRVI